MCSITKTRLNLTTLVGGRTFSLPVKIQRHYHSYDIAETEYDNQVALSPTNVKGEGIKF